MFVCVVVAAAAVGVHVVVVLPLLRLVFIVVDRVDHHLGTSPSKEVLGAQGALRVCFGNFLFSVIMALALFGVRTKDDARHPFQTDLWFIKAVMWIGCIALPFFFPNVLIKIFAEVSATTRGL